MADSMEIEKENTEQTNPLWEERYAVWCSLRFGSYSAKTAKLRVAKAFDHDSGHVICIPSGVSARTSRDEESDDEMIWAKALIDFFAGAANPAVFLEDRTLSQVMSQDHIYEERYILFHHVHEIPWLFPGIQPTSRQIGIPFCFAVKFLPNSSKICSLRIYWDQASALKQIGCLPISHYCKSNDTEVILPTIGVNAADNLLHHFDEEPFSNILCLPKDSDIGPNYVEESNKPSNSSTLNNKPVNKRVQSPVSKKILDDSNRLPPSRKPKSTAPTTPSRLRNSSRLESAETSPENVKKLTFEFGLSTETTKLPSDASKGYLKKNGSQISFSSTKSNESFIVSKEVNSPKANGKRHFEESNISSPKKDTFSSLGKMNGNKNVSQLVMGDDGVMSPSRKNIRGSIENRNAESEVTPKKLKTNVNPKRYESSINIYNSPTKKSNQTDEQNKLNSPKSGKKSSGVYFNNSSYGFTKSKNDNNKKNEKTLKLSPSYAGAPSDNDSNKGATNNMGKKHASDAFVHKSQIDFSSPTKSSLDKTRKLFCDRNTESIKPKPNSPMSGKKIFPKTAVHSSQFALDGSLNKSDENKSENSKAQEERLNCRARDMKSNILN